MQLINHKVVQSSDPRVLFFLWVGPLRNNRLVRYGQLNDAPSTKSHIQVFYFQIGKDLGLEPHSGTVKATEASADPTHEDIES